MLIDKWTRDANYGPDPIVCKIDNPKNETFQITDIKIAGSSCYFVKRKWQKAFRKIKIWI